MEKTKKKNKNKNMKTRREKKWRQIEIKEHIQNTTAERSDSIAKVIQAEKKSEKEF